MPPFEVDKTPSRGMGAIAENFRSFPGTKRSNHPNSSFCANGSHSHFITKDHSLEISLGKNTPLGKLYELDAHVLLLGVDYDNCTCLHLAESLLPNPEHIPCGTAILENGARVWKWYNDQKYNDDDFITLGNSMEKAHPEWVKKGKVGNSNCKFF